MRLPFVVVINMVSTLKKVYERQPYRKIILAKGAMIFTHEGSAILQNKLLEKREDPGSFTLPCTIRDLKFDRYLYDLGASVSLIPFSISQRLWLYEFKQSKISLVLTDRVVPY